jgi:hypothetical protein
MIKHFKDLGYGQIQLNDQLVLTPSGKQVRGVRGNISVANIEDTGLKPAKDDAKYFVRVSSSDGELSCVIKGCQVDAAIFFNHITEDVGGDVWVLDKD